MNIGFEWTGVIDKAQSTWIASSFLTRWRSCGRRANEAASREPHGLTFVGEHRVVHKLQRVVNAGSGLWESTVPPP